MGNNIYLKPTEVDLLINKEIFHRCNHEHWVTVSHSDFSTEVVCTLCGESYPAPEDQDELIRDLKEFPADFLQSFVPRYSEQPIFEPQLIRRLAELGWQAVLRTEINCYSCELKGHSQVVRGNICTSQLQALCDATAQLIRLGLHK
jgi:hypothetical protein